MSVPTKFRDAFMRTFHEDVRNSHTNPTLSSVGLPGGGMKIYASESVREIYKSFILPDAVSSDKDLKDCGDSLGRTIAAKVNDHDDGLFKGVNVVEETYEEWVNDEKVKRTRLVKTTHSGMLRGMSEVDERIWKGIKGGDWESGLSAAQKAAEEDRLRKLQEVEDKRRAAQEKRSWEEEQRRLAIQREQEEREMSKAAFYDRVGGYGEF